MFLMGGVAIFPYLYLERVSVAVRRYRVPIRALPAALEGFTILHLSDLHDKEFGPGGAELLDLIAHERFDLVALTGDLVAGHAPQLTPALELIAGIRKLSPVPILAVNGNHDWRLGRAPEFNAKMREAGATILTNASLPVERNGSQLWIAGVDDPVTGRARLQQALARTHQREPRLLLSHSPHTFELAVSHGVDLTLTGHTHGGQIRLPLLGACYVPAMGFFPRYDYGYYRSGSSSLIVSGGLGESGLPVRFNIRPEIPVITLTATSA
jgi:predicted MPP superfamily phosphohydrolase